MKKYLKTQWEALKAGFKIESPMQCVLLELAKYFFMLIIIAISLKIILASLYGTMPLLLSAQAMNALTQAQGTGYDGNDIIDQALAQQILENAGLLKTLIVRLVLTMLGLVIIGCFAISYINVAILERLGLRKHSTRAFAHIALISIAYTLLLGLIGVIVMHNSYNMIVILSMITAMGLLLHYISLVYLSSAEGKSFLADLKKGSYNAIILHRNIWPIVAGVIIAVLFIPLAALLSMLLGDYTLLALVPLVALWSVWLKNYQFKLIHMYAHEKKHE